jgi:putative radical SAM enzyme (TIGR03279 family)
MVFLAAQEVLEVEVRRADQAGVLVVERRPGEFLGATFRGHPVRQCANKCIFCFIDQMPRGLRKTLYVKDEDVLHSLVNGNYVTLSNVGPTELARIADRGVSPLYVSVHATDRAVRSRMLGIARSPDVLEQLRCLVRRGIRLHTQIVVCPGVNDGAVLRRTVRALLALGERLESVAVVPVGITRHRRVPLRGMDRDGAVALCEALCPVSDADAVRRGRRRLFLADEFLILAGRSIPPQSYYADFPQIENGVGLVRQLLDEWRRVERGLGRRAPTVRTSERGRRVLVVTSALAYPYLQRIARQLSERSGRAHVEALAVPNRFFGETVTVAGLLTATDIVRAVCGTGVRWDTVVVPSVLLNSHGHTLDGWSISRIKRHIGVPVVAAESVGDLARQAIAAPVSTERRPRS